MEQVTVTVAPTALQLQYSVVKQKKECSHHTNVTSESKGRRMCCCCCYVWWLLYKMNIQLVRVALVTLSELTWAQCREHPVGVRNVMGPCSFHTEVSAKDERTSESLSSLCTKEARGSGHARRSPVQTRTPVLEAGFDLTSRKCTQRDGIILTWWNPAISSQLFRYAVEHFSKAQVDKKNHLSR